MNVQTVKKNVADLEREIKEFQSTSQNNQGVLRRLEPRGGVCVKQKDFMDSLVKKPGFLNGGVIGPCGM